MGLTIHCGLQGERIKTGLTGDSWQSFCKTQYASDPRLGGVEQFLRCHRDIVELLDRAGQDLIEQIDF